MKHKISRKQRQKEQSRQKILKAAAKLFRKNGFAATGIDAIVNEAGLTAGAFYAHFDSKQKLFEESLRLSLCESALVLGRAGAKLSQDPQKFLRSYLSSAHRDHPESGCLIATLGPEILRSPKAVRAVLGKDLPKVSNRLFILSAAVGALMVSRLIEDRESSDQFLKLAVRRLARTLPKERAR